jgi:hypothetical protein
MKTRKQKQAPPISLRLRPEVREKVEKVAEKNGLSLHAMINLCAAAGVKIVEKNLEELQPKAA